MPKLPSDGSGLRLPCGALALSPSPRLPRRQQSFRRPPLREAKGPNENLASHRPCPPSPPACKRGLLDGASTSSSTACTAHACPSQLHYSGYCRVPLPSNNTSKLVSHSGIRTHTQIVHIYIYICTYMHIYTHSCK